MREGRSEKKDRAFVTERDSGRNGSPVDPEGHPGEDDHQHGGEVRLQHEEEDVPPQDEVDEEPVVPTCRHQKNGLENVFRQTNVSNVKASHE